MKTIRHATPDDCALIYELAVPSWKVAYSEILSGEQMDYMLKKMYSEESLTRQMREGHIFFIVLCDDIPSGFISFHPQGENLYILEKLYILPHTQGTGAGRFLVEQAEEYIRNLHPAGRHFLFELNVNRNNKAVDFYKRLGFHIDREVDEDIGNGFYKNDYIMRKDCL
jgi:GNAT superfamily N-acetyltransferase